MIRVERLDRFITTLVNPIQSAGHDFSAAGEVQSCVDISRESNFLFFQELKGIDLNVL